MSWAKDIGSYGVIGINLYEANKCIENPVDDVERASFLQHKRTIYQLFNQLTLAAVAAKGLQYMITKKIGESMPALEEVGGGAVDILFFEAMLNKNLPTKLTEQQIKEFYEYVCKKSSLDSILQGSF